MKHTTLLLITPLVLILMPLGASAADCDAALGQWSWFTGGRVVVESNQVLKYDGANFGRWECTGPGRMTLRWDSGFTNLVVVSADSRTIVGGSEKPGFVFGTRVGNAPRPTTPKAATPAPPRSQTSESGARRPSSGASAATAIAGPKVTKPKEFHYDAKTEGLFQQGLRLYEGKNAAGAYPHLKQAADAGHARAQSLLGIMYRSGKGVTKDLRTAATWFEKAADQEHRAAAYHLGNMYDVGDGIPVNKPLAVKYYDIAARQGFYEAQFELAFNYEFGQGTPRNRQMAIFWLQQAQLKGDGLAGWVGSFLRDPTTPHFQTPTQLRNYISAKVTAWVSSITPQGGGSSSSASSGGSSSSGGDGCGSYTNHGACNAYKAGNEWAADRLQRGESPPSEKAWFGR